MNVYTIEDLVKRCELVIDDEIEHIIKVRELALHASGLKNRYPDLVIERDHYNGCDECGYEYIPRFRFYSDLVADDVVESEYITVRNLTKRYIEVEAEKEQRRLDERNAMAREQKAHRARIALRHERKGVKHNCPCDFCQSP